MRLLVMLAAGALASSDVETAIAAIDSDSDGKITQGELSRFMAARAQANRDNKVLQVTAEAKQMYGDVVEKYDKNSDGQLSLEEMMIQEWAVHSFATSATTLKLMFAVADEDGNGLVSPSEMVLMTHPDYSENAPAKLALLVANFVDEWDQDEDGKIDENEYLQSEARLHVDFSEAQQTHASEEFEKYEADGDNKLDAKELEPLIAHRHRADDWDLEASHMLSAIGGHDAILNGLDAQNIVANPSGFLEGIKQAARDEL
jgi:Ca2+-binding EF-hand superfamily protein